MFRSAATVGLLVLLEMTLVLVGAHMGSEAATRCRCIEGSNTKALGRLIYVDYVYPFEIAAVVLLVAIIAAIALTHRTRKESTKHQDPGAQVKVRREDQGPAREHAVGKQGMRGPSHRRSSALRNGRSETPGIHD